MAAEITELMLSSVTGAIRRCFYIPEHLISNDTHLFDDLAFDSLDVLEVALSLEENLGIEFPRLLLQRFRYVSDITTYLSSCYFRDVSERELIAAA